MQKFPRLTLIESIQADAMANHFSTALRVNVSDQTFEALNARNKEPFYLQNDMTAIQDFFDNDDIMNAVCESFRATMGRNFDRCNEADREIVLRAELIAAGRGYLPEPEEDEEPTPDEIALLQSAGRVDPPAPYRYPVGSVNLTPCDDDRAENWYKSPSRY